MLIFCTAFHTAHIFLVVFNRFAELSRTSGLFPGLCSPGKCHNKIPGLSRFSRTPMNPAFRMGSCGFWAKSNAVSLGVSLHQSNVGLHTCSFSQLILLYLPTQIRFLIGGERVTCHWSKLNDALGRRKLNDALGKQHLELWTCM